MACSGNGIVKLSEKVAFEPLCRLDRAGMSFCNMLKSRAIYFSSFYDKDNNQDVSAEISDNLTIPYFVEYLCALCAG